MEPKVHVNMIHINWRMHNASSGKFNNTGGIMPVFTPEGFDGNELTLSERKVGDWV